MCGVCAGVCGYAPVGVGVCGCVQVCTSVHRCTRVCVGVHGWVDMGVRGCVCTGAGGWVKELTIECSAHASRRNRLLVLLCAPMSADVRSSSSALSG